MRIRLLLTFSLLCHAGIAGAAEPSPSSAHCNEILAHKTSGPNPRFPPAAARHNVEGFAQIKVRTDSSGAVSTADLVREQPAGAGFGSAAMEVVPQWTFAEKNAQFSYTVSFRFGPPRLASPREPSSPCAPTS